MPEPGVVAYSRKPSTWAVEVGCTFEASLGYTVRPYLKKPKPKNKQAKTILKPKTTITKIPQTKMQMPLQQCFLKCDHPTDTWNVGSRAHS
jgi:hypothetical protein